MERLLIITLWEELLENNHPSFTAAHVKKKIILLDRYSNPSGRYTNQEDIFSSHATYSRLTCALQLEPTTGVQYHDSKGMLFFIGE